MYQKPKEIVKLAADVATHPTVPISLGNVVLATQTAEPIGIGLNVATLLSASGLKLYQEISGKEVGLPFYVLSAVNALSSASVLYEGGQELGGSALLEFHGEAMKYIFSSAAFAGWSIGHGIAGYKASHPEVNFGKIKNEQTWYGVADLAAVKGNYFSSAVFALGLAKALYGDPSEVKEVDSLSTLMQKHITPARLYGCGYILGSLLSLNDPAFATAQASWGAGYFCFDGEQNQSFLSDVKTVIESGLNALTTELVSLRMRNKPLVSFDIGGADVSLKSLLSESLSITEKLRFGLGMTPGTFWDKAALTASEVYPSLEAKDREMGFAVMEVIAPKSLFMREFISYLAHDKRDGLALAKIRRLTARLLGGGDDNPNMSNVNQVKNILP